MKTETKWTQFDGIIWNGPYKIADLSKNPNHPTTDAINAMADRIVKCVNAHDLLMDLLAQTANRLQLFYDQSDESVDVEGSYVSDPVLDRVEEFQALMKD